MSKAALDIAVLGGGVAGIVSAYLLDRKHRVTLYEKNQYLGGHTNTIVIPDGPDAGTPVDTGFIVLNDKTYPLFHRFLAELDIPVRESDMSFSYYCKRSNFQYAGTTLNGLFAQRSNLLSPRFWRLLAGIGRFCREARQMLRENSIGSATLGEYLATGRYSATVIDEYIIPMGGAIWSAPREEMLKFPIEGFVRFFDNHGLLSFFNRPKWQTVVGGSHSYVKRFKEVFKGNINLNCAAESVRRSDSGVDISFGDGASRRFDAVVIAAHADQALSLLEDPSGDESRLLGAWQYQKNHTVLHTDDSVLPPLRRAWASWNYICEPGSAESDPVSVTYYMNLLQGLSTVNNYFVTLNSGCAIREDAVVCEIEYTHPVYTRASFDTQQELPALNGVNRTYFCGSYFAYGFHEDAVRSAVAVGKNFGVDL